MSRDVDYRTVDGPGEAAIMIAGSRFVSVVAEASTIDEAEVTIERMADAHPDATHVVPAYRVRSTMLREWSSDDGEPSGSAGKPILSVLQGEDLENVVAVVARYYGGTDLGIGGLVRAYGSIVTHAIDSTTIIERAPTRTLSVTSDYDDSGTVRSVLERCEVSFDAEYTEDVRLIADIPVSELECVRDQLLSATSGRVEIVESR